MKKQYLTCLVLTILTVGLVFTACDLLQGGTGDTTAPETFDPLVINGKDSDGNPVSIEFSRPAAERAALTSSTLKDGDTYKIFHKGVLVSSGTIKKSGNTVTFTPESSYSGSTFQGTLGNSGSVSTITFVNGEIPLSNGTITGFEPDGTGGGGNGSTDAKYVEALFASDNAKASGSTVVISGSVTVTNDISIPSTVELVFNTNVDDMFRIRNGKSVTAKGGIKIPSGKGVTVIGEGILVVEGNSTISGRLNIGNNENRGKLDISGSGTVFTIADGGVFWVLADDTVAKVSTNLYDTPMQGGMDAELKGNGTIVVEKGGRFYVPDPSEFEVSNISGLIKVKAGGELIVITAAINVEWFNGVPLDITKIDKDDLKSTGVQDYHPVIGTLSTATEGYPVQADYVMDPVNYPDSRIEARFNSGIPVFELYGYATAMGRLILNQNIYVDQRTPPFRREIWLTSPFTVTEGSELWVGSQDVSSVTSNMRTALLVTGGNGIPTKYMGPPYLKGETFVVKPNIKMKGVLTNNGKIRIFNNNGIVEWLGGYFNAGSNVYQHKTNTIVSGNPSKVSYANDTGGKYNGYSWVDVTGIISINMWSPSKDWYANGFTDKEKLKWYVYDTVSEEYRLWKTGDSEKPKL